MCTLAAPLLHTGLPAGHDLPAHATYTYLFDLAIGEGQVPVRWTEGVRAGDSQPLFSFYQPGFYYLVQLVHVVVRSLALSLKLTVAGLWWLGAGFMYLLCARYGRAAAACGALMFAFSPYLLLDVYVRAAYPELAAITLAVGVLWALERLCQRPGSRTVALVAILLGTMLICHLPSAVIFLPVFALRVGLLSMTAASKAGFLRWLAVAAALGVGLAAFYWVPALGERRLIRLSALTRDYFDYRNHFVQPVQWLRYEWGFGGSVPGTGDGLSFQIGVVQWAVAGACCVRLVAASLRRRLIASDWELIAWAISAALAMWMMTGASAAVWTAMPALSYIQFPWRYSMVLAVAFGAMAANLLGRVKGTAASAAWLAVTFGALLFLSAEQRRPDHYMPAADMDIDLPYWRYLPRAQKNAFVEVGYFPIAARSSGARETARRSARRWEVVSGSAEVMERSLKEHAVELDVDAHTDAALVVTSHVFPEWTVWVDGREVPVRPEAARGYLQFDVPRGRHRVEARLRDTGLRRAANGVSLVSALLLLTFVLFRAWSRRQIRRAKVS